MILSRPRTSFSTYDFVLPPTPTKKNHDACPTDTDAIPFGLLIRLLAKLMIDMSSEWE